MRPWVWGLLLAVGVAWGQDQPVRTVAEGVKAAGVSDKRHELAFYDGSDLQVWDFVGLVVQARWVSVGAPRWLRFSPDERTLVAGLNENRLVAFDLKGERRWIFRTDEVPEPVDFSFDSKVLAVALPGHRTVELLDTLSGRLQGTVPSPPHAHATCFSFSPASARLAVGWDDHHLELTDEVGKTLTTTLRPAPISQIAWSPDGQRMLVGEGLVTRVLEGSDLLPSLTFDTEQWQLSPASWSPHSTHFALHHFRAPTKFGLSLHELPDGRSMRYDETTDKVGVDWSPDDHLMAISTGRVRVYRLIDGELAYTAPDFNTRQAWFAPYGHRMVVWTWGGSLKAWDF